MTITAVAELHNDSTSAFKETYYVEDDAQATINRVQAITEALREFDIQTHPDVLDIQSCDVQQLCHFAWRITVNLPSARAGKPLTPMVPAAPERYPGTVDELEKGEERTKERSFDYSASPEFFQNAISQKWVTFHKQQLFDVGLMINVQPNGWGFDVQGMTLEVPPITDRISFKVLNADMTDAYIADVRKLCGKTNTQPFMGNAAGTVRLVEARSGISSDKDHTVTFGFSYKDKKTHVETRRDNRAIQIQQETGHDLVWRMIYPGQIVLVDGVHAPIANFDMEPMAVNFPETSGIFCATVLESGGFADLKIP